MEKGHCDRVIARYLSELFLGLKLSPAGCKPSRILGRIRIPNHYFLLAIDYSHIYRNAKEGLHCRGSTVQVIESLKERDNSKRLLDSCISLQQQDSQHIAGMRGLTNYVGTETTFSHFRNHAKGL
jgi:hypothetical protein